MQFKFAQFVRNKAKGRISKRVFQENKARQLFRKMSIFYPLIRTRKKCPFFEKFGVLWSSRFDIRPLALLPTNLILTLEHDSVLAIEWFECNYMKLSQDKCHLPILGHKNESMWVNIDSCKIWKNIDQKLLGANIDRNLKFSRYIFK